MGAMLSVAAVTKSSRTAGDGTKTSAGNDDVTGASQTGGVTGAGGTVADGVTAAPVTGTKAGATTPADAKTGTTTGATNDEETDDWENWSLCGLDDSDEEMEEWTPEERIKTSQLTPEEKKKFESIVAQCFMLDTLWGKRINFDYDDVMEVLTKVIPYLESEPMLIEDVPFGAMIVGDLHGQLHDLHRAFTINSTDDKPGWYNGRYVFLGNYVDKGRQSLEIIMALFCLKMLRPDDIFLLRGNHEFVLVNVKFGLVGEINRRYEKKLAKILFYQMNETFCYLSIAAIMGGKYLCCHSGIALEGFTRLNLRGIQKPLVESGDDVIVHGVVTSKPLEGIKGAMLNCSKEVTSFYFGFDSLMVAFECMQVTAMFRGNKVLKTGFANNWNCCFTVYTAVCVGGGRNQGSVAVVGEDGNVIVHTLAVDEQRRTWDKEMFAEEGLTEWILAGCPTTTHEA